MFEVKNYDECKDLKTGKAIKDDARAYLMEYIYNLIVADGGADHISQVGTGEYSVHIGDKTDEQGIAEICVNLKFIAKEFEETGKNGAYQRNVEAEDFEEEQKEKKADAEKKKVDAEKKKAADKAARELKKQLKEAKRAKRAENKEDTATDKIGQGE